LEKKTSLKINTYLSKRKTNPRKKEVGEKKLGLNGILRRRL